MSGYNRSCSKADSSILLAAQCAAAFRLLGKPVEEQFADAPSLGVAADREQQQLGFAGDGPSQSETDRGVALARKDQPDAGHRQQPGVFVEV